MNGPVLKYDEQGSGSPVVLIHGFPLCRMMWQPQAAALSDAGFRVLCPDLPGFGESSLAEGPVTMSMYADAVIGLLDEIGIDKAVVGGMSMGGYVLLNMVERYPERLTGAMFLVTRAAADDAAGRQKRTALAEAVSAGDERIVSDTFSKVLFSTNTAEINPQLVAEVRRWMESTSAAGLVGGLLAMRDRDDSLAKLKGFALPSLVVGAEQDLAVPIEHCRIMAGLLPDAKLQIIPGAGHMANLEQPELFNAALLTFLRQFKL